MATALIELLRVIRQLSALTGGRVADDCDHVLTLPRRSSVLTVAVPAVGACGQ
jgi:hypothetical protein